MHRYNFCWLADRLKCCLDLIYKKDPKMARKNVRKIEVPTDTPTEFELGDTTSDIQRRREEREHREKGGDRETTEGGDRGFQEYRNSTGRNFTDEGGSS